MITSQDGGNVHTTHNVRQGIYASDKEKQAYENRGEYDSDIYHKDKTYKEINKEQSALKKEGKLDDYMTGKKINPNDKTDLDHIVAAKTIDNDRARVLAEVDGKQLANTRTNLKMTDRSLNRSKKDKSAEEVIKNIDNKSEKLAQNETKRGYLTQNEQKEKAKLMRQKEMIDDEKFLEEYEKSKKKIDKEVDKAYYTSSKPYKELFKTGTKDSAEIAIYSAVGVVLRDFVAGMISELKILIKEFGNESIPDIIKRFSERLKMLWENLKAKWKDIFAGSIESAFQAFFSNLVVFVINIFVTTSKNIVRIIRAGFVSLWQAVKIIINSPADMPMEDRISEASKLLVSGLITAGVMLGSTAIANWLKTIPKAKTLFDINIPLINESVGDAIVVCLSGAIGAMLSTIVIYYMDKFANKKKIEQIEIQLVAQNGVVVQYEVAKTWCVLHDALMYADEITNRYKQFLSECKKRIDDSARKVDEALDELSRKNDEFSKLIEQIQNKG